MSAIVVAKSIHPLSNFLGSSRFQGRERGQGMTEYIVIVALIAVAAIGVYQLFGQAVRSQTAAIVQEVGGVSGTTSMRRAQGAGAAVANEIGKKGLNEYTGARDAAAAGAGQ